MAEFLKTVLRELFKSGYISERRFDGRSGRWIEKRRYYFGLRDDQPAITDDDPQD